MKEATGEVSMTVITLVAIAVIGAILALMWPSIKDKISGLWGGIDANSQGSCEAVGGTWSCTGSACQCKGAKKK